VGEDKIMLADVTCIRKQSLWPKGLNDVGRA